MISAAPIIHLGVVQAESPAALRALQSWSTDEDRDSGRRRDSVLCRALTREMLAGMTGSTALTAQPWRISSMASGKPVAVDPAGSHAPAISMSHSGPWVAYAASFAGEIGIDVEVSRTSRDHRAIADRAFGPQEAAVTRNADQGRFYAIWTLREAIAKATGAGLKMAADAADRVSDGPYQSARWVRLDGADWWLMHAQPAAEVSLAVALRLSDGGGTDQHVQLQWWPESA